MSERTDIEIADGAASTNGAAAQIVLAEPDPAQRPARLAFYLGVTLAIVGAIVLYLGYDGAATHALVQAQIPFLISGGLLGAALLVIGTVVIGLHVLLRVQADLRAELAQTRRSMERLAEVMTARAVGGVVAPSANGTVMVARGGSSYHRADCKLVARAASAQPFSREDAAGSGLVPCRICKP